MFKYQASADISRHFPGRKERGLILRGGKGVGFDGKLFSYLWKIGDRDILIFFCTIDFFI